MPVKTILRGGTDPDKEIRHAAPTPARLSSGSAHCTLFLAGSFSGSVDWGKINEEMPQAAVRAAVVEGWSFQPEARSPTPGGHMYAGEAR